MTLIKHMLLLTVLIINFPAWAENTATNKLDREIRQAFDNFTERYKGDRKELTEPHLRLYVLREKSPDIFPAQRALLIEEQYPEAFIRLFDEAVQWQDHINSDDGKLAFERSKEYEARSNIELYARLARTLRFLAERKQHIPSLYAKATRYFEDTSHDKSREACRILSRLGETGEVKAALELGQRYKDGKGLPKDPVRALFWLGQSTVNYVKQNDDLHTEMLSVRQRIKSGNASGSDIEKYDAMRQSSIAAVSPELNEWISEVSHQVTEEDLRTIELWSSRDFLTPSCPYEE